MVAARRPRGENRRCARPECLMRPRRANPAVPDGPPGSAGVPPAVGRRPTPTAKRWDACDAPRPMPAPLGARASRPQVGRRPTGVFKRARCPRSQESVDAERSFPGSRASRPQWAAGPPPPLSAGTRATRRGRCRPPGSAGVPPASGPQAHRCSRARGRPARKWAAGPPPPPSAGTRATRRGRCRPPGSAGVPPAVGRRPTPTAKRRDACDAPRPMPAPWERGRPARSGPQAHPHRQAPGRVRRAAADAGPLGARASRPQVGRRPTPTAKRRDACDAPRPMPAPWERGRPARKWAAGPQVFKRVGRPRSRGPGLRHHSRPASPSAPAPAPILRRLRSGDETIASPSPENGVPMTRSARRHIRPLPRSAA